MKIPPLHVLNSPIVEDGMPTMHFHQMMTQLVQELQKNLGEAGYVFPAQSQSVINSLNTQQHASKIIYNADSNSMQLNNEGEFKDIYTRPPQLTTSERMAIATDKINGSWVFDTDLNKLYYGINQIWREVAFT